MSTSIEGRVVGSVGFDSFADLTTARLESFTSSGVLFDGDLTDTEIGDVWWRMTSLDACDQTCREDLAVLIAEAESKPYNENTKWLTDAFARLARYQIRLEAS